VSRAINLDLEEGQVVARCLAEKVGISTIERLPSGGVRLVCMSVDGAQLIRRKLKSHLLETDQVRQRHRPTTPLW
jgi:hypothetical protein